MEVYIVKDGDTLQNIAYRHNLSLKELQQINQGLLIARDGQEILLPSESIMKYVQVKGGKFVKGEGLTLDINQADIFSKPGQGNFVQVHVKKTVTVCQPYCIKSGDTLWKICEDFGVFMADVLKMNKKIVNPDLIYAGDVIYLPQRAY